MAYFCFIFIIILLVGMLSSFVFFLFSLYHYRDYSFCIQPGCLEKFLSLHSDSLKILNWTISLLVSYSAISAIIVALLSYINSTSSSALGAHISHYKVFQEYLNFELARKAKIEPSSINSLQWYNLIFDKSRLGSTTVSDNYKNQISKLNQVISDSNNKSDKAQDGSFSYKEHQGKIIFEVSKMGIRLERAPRNDFYVIESELLELIAVINVEFCSVQGIPPIMLRKYI